ncbi:MAG: cell division protein FtsL [Deltaproteobacteria bacterium]|nr:cell division protein FtsL [Deltaproteobacteria bacterium]
MVRRNVKKKPGSFLTPQMIRLGIFLMALFIGELLSYTWCRVQYTRTGYELSREMQEHRQLTAVEKKLKIELARLRSPERLAKLAKRHMGLNMPTSQQVMVIE